MEIASGCCRWLSGWMRPQTHNIAMALVATVLVIYGEDINSAIKKAIQKYHFIARTLVFVAVCAFGYGTMAVLFTKLVAFLLGEMGNVLLPVAVVVLFLVVGQLAQHKKQI
ncbi:MAG: DUF3392 family protein [Planctomycetota bacterium]